MQTRLRSIDWRRWGVPVGIALLFVAISLVYFLPAVLDGKDLYQHDVAGASGTAQDVRDYQAQTGETAYWTNSLFSGMPMYQIAPSYPSLSVLKAVQDFLTLQWPMKLLPSYSWLIFAMLAGFWLLMRSLSVGRLVAVLGAIMWAFSSYFIILITAGHIWKLMVLAFIPPTIAGIIYTFKGRYLLGGVVTTFFAALQLMSNHIQMSYYFAFVIAMLVVAFVVEAARARAWKHLGIALGTTALSALLAISMNASSLYHTYEYTQETMRGGSALTAGEGSAGASTGLDKDYITQWSYGKAETLTLLIPNVYGGGTGRLGDNPDAMREVPAHLREAVGGQNHYWGDQPFTVGPVYVGAFVLALFVLGLFVVRGPIKWALLGATLLSIALSWGHNMMWLTDLFIDHFPLYNKFRTVSSILVIAEFTIPTLAILALLEVIRHPHQVRQNRLAWGVSLALTAGVCLVVAVMPATCFSLLSGQEQELYRNYMTNPEAVMVFSALQEARATIVSADAWRSLMVILLSTAACWLYVSGRMRQTYMVAALVVITLVDLWLVDKRYLSDKDFISPALIAQRGNPITPVDLEIRRDADLHYRVFNTAVSPFSDATTSFMHRSVGGYHAAKLGRYQDLIDAYLSKGNEAVLNMLDVRYVIYPKEYGSLGYMRNDSAFGAAWLVDLDRVSVANSPREELEALGQINLREQAIVLKDEAAELGAPATPAFARDSAYVADTAVHLDLYTPDRIRYQVKTDQPRLLVMSEVYYPHGWTMTIDGQQAPIHRVNYLLRATRVEAGQHTIELRFDPPSLHITERLAWGAQLLLLLGLMALGVQAYRRNKSTTI